MTFREWFETWGGPGSGNFGHAGRKGKGPGGSMPGGSYVIRDVKDALYSKVLEDKTPFDIHGTRKGREYAIVINPDGSTKEYTGEGEDSEMRFSDEELKSMRDTDFIHTHPSGSSFSLDDIRIASHTHMNSMQAVGVDYEGRGWLYTMKPGASRSWPSEGMIFAEHGTQERAIYSRNNAKLSEMTLSEQRAAIPELNHTHAHDIWTQVAASLGMRYSREEIK